MATTKNAREAIADKLKLSNSKRRFQQRMQNLLIFVCPVTIVIIAIFLSTSSSPSLESAEDIAWPADARSLKSVGDKSYAAKDYQNAVRSYMESFKILNETENAELRPSMAIIANSIATSYSGLNNWPSAQGWFKVGIDLDPENALLRFSYANNLLAKDQLVQAEIQYRKALKIKPDFSRAMTGLSSVLRKHGLIDEPKQLLFDALKLEPENPTILGNIGLQYLAEKDVDKAVDYLQQAADRGHKGAREQLDNIHKAIEKLKEDAASKQGSNQDKANPTAEIKEESGDQRLDSMF